MEWISKIADGITTAFSSVRLPATPIPPILLLCEIYNRPGLSAMSLASAVIARLPEMGFDTGVNADGSENMVNMFVKIFSEEIVNEIKNNGVVNSALQPSGMNITGTAIDGAVTATNADFVKIDGIPR